MTVNGDHVSIGSAAIPITENEKYELEKTGIRFMDITEDDLEATYAEFKVTGRIQALASCTCP